MILGVLLAIGIFGGFIIGVPFFIAWVAHEHLQAKKLRHLMVLANQQIASSANSHSSGPQWTVTYRDKGKIKTVVASGETEEKMFLDLVKSKSIGFDKIISSVKN